MTEYYGICMVVAITAVALYALMNFGTFAILKGIEWYKRTRNKESEKAINNVVDNLTEKVMKLVKEIKQKEESKKNTVDYSKVKKEESELEDVDLDDILPY